MYLGKTLFAQVMDFLPWKTFQRIAERYGADHRIRTLPSSEHFRVMAFAQLTYRESLRDIETCLAAQAGKLYHMGIGQPVARATLADANERRDWRLYAEFAQRLIARARALYATETCAFKATRNPAVEFEFMFGRSTCTLANVRCWERPQRATPRPSSSRS